MVSERGRFVLRRIAGAVPLVLIVYTITFVLIRSTPGNPFAARSNRTLTGDALAQIESYYGLDRPWYQQYLGYLTSAVRGDFGPSYSKQGQSVSEILGRTIGVSLTLVLAALVVAAAIGIPVGVLAAQRRGSVLDRAVSVVTSIALATPAFVIVPALTILLGVYGGLVPTGGWDGLFSASAVVPIIALAASPAAVLTSYTRASLSDALSSDFVRTAWAQGLRRRTVLWHRSLKNGSAPVLTAFGTEAAATFAAVLVVETVAGIPGFGYEMVAAFGSRDYPIVMAGTLVLATLVAASSVTADAAYAMLDPRVRVGAKA
ncbi:MAG: ABC transporter permease [Actinomycetes bacterium]|jgi:oligopeptide transport system permease protein